MIHGPYYRLQHCQVANNVRAGPGQDQHQFSSTPNPHHPPPDKASWTWRYSASACNVTALPEAILEGKHTTPINHHKLHFFGLHLLSSASIQHMARTVPKTSNSKFQIPEGPLLDSRCLQCTVSVT
jgi:hypothetical protein